jgi:hypothetical protein
VSLPLSLAYSCSCCSFISVPIMHHSSVVLFLFCFLVPASVLYCCCACLVDIFGPFFPPVCFVMPSLSVLSDFPYLCLAVLF